MRRSAKVRNRALLTLPLAAILLAADLAVPGWGTFPNPMFYGKWAAATITGALQKDVEGDSSAYLGDSRLTPCQVDSVAISTEQVGAEASLSSEQAALRDTLVGNTSVLAVQQLGSPVCQLVNGSWRWLLTSGLSLDVQVADDGTITHADLTH